MTGDAYRGSGLSELSKGIFFQSESGALVRMRSLAQARQAVKGVRGFRLMEREREKVINKMVKDWFYDNEGEHVRNMRREPFCVFSCMVKKDALWQRFCSLIWNPELPEEVTST